MSAEEDGLEFPDQPAPEPAPAPEKPAAEEKPTTRILKVGDGLEIRGAKYLVAAINEKGWLILQPFEQHTTVKREGIGQMIQRLGIIPVRRKIR